MISLFEHIEYLLNYNECVIVPDWGALIIHHESASFHDDRVTPPSQMVSFNPAITHNDGLLASSLVRRHSISYSDAVKLISDNVTIFRTQVAQYSEMPFGRIGYFRQNENALEFHPFAGKKRYDDFYALTSLEMPSLLALSHADDTFREEQEKSFIARFLANGARMARVAASIAVLVILSVLLTTPIIVNDSQQNYASMSVTTVSGPKAAEMQSQPATVATVDQELAVEPQVATATKTAYKYHLIISAWKTAEQAQLFISENADLNLSIYEKNGNFLISAADSDDYSQLVQHMSTLPAQFRNSWVSD